MYNRLIPAIGEQIANYFEKRYLRGHENVRSSVLLYHQSKNHGRLDDCGDTRGVKMGGRSLQ